MNTLCPCGSRRLFRDCCEPFILNQKHPSTAEELMRSRYSAFTVAATGYLLKTSHPRLRKQLKEEDLLSWARENQWQRLEVSDTIKGQPADTEGEVTFKAFYLDPEGKPQVHHEHSRFVKDENRWLYLSGSAPSPLPRKTPGRNEPCPCGSGKKFKQCCG